MRLASVLLVVTMLTTCVISGTFAKYVTKEEGSDGARVAKWGVELAINGSNFADQYKTHDTTKYDGTYSVSAGGDKVVAPGTSSAGKDWYVAWWNTALWGFR